MHYTKRVAVVANDGTTANLFEVTDRIDGQGNLTVRKIKQFCIIDNRISGDLTTGEPIIITKSVERRDKNKHKFTVILKYEKWNCFKVRDDGGNMIATVKDNILKDCGLNKKEQDLIHSYTGGELYDYVQSYRRPMWIDYNADKKNPFITKVTHMESFHTADLFNAITTKLGVTLSHFELFHDKFINYRDMVDVIITQRLTEQDSITRRIEQVATNHPPYEEIIFTDPDNSAQRYRIRLGFGDQPLMWMQVEDEWHALTPGGWYGNATVQKCAARYTEKLINHWRGDSYDSLVNSLNNQFALIKLSINWTNMILEVVPENEKDLFIKWTQFTDNKPNYYTEQQES